MAVGFPTKANWAAGDVLTAAQMDDLAGTVNTVSAPLYNAAGKNVVLNSAFQWWQRGTTFTNPNGYTADRLYAYSPATTYTVTQQTFTPGAAPVAGYEGSYFPRFAITTIGSATDFQLQNRIEGVRTFAGQTVTFSFWAKADSARSFDVNLIQNFGTGGSPSAGVTTKISTFTVSISWTRYSASITLPSISGKTIGSNNDNYLAIQFYGNISAGYVLDTWGWQLEAGSTATGFQTATGTLQGELAACQRYYYLLGGTASNSPLGTAFNGSTTVVYLVAQPPVTMRTTPTIDQTTGTNYYVAVGKVFNSWTGIDQASTKYVELYLSTTGLTAGQAGYARVNASGGYLALSAEL